MGSKSEFLASNSFSRNFQVVKAQVMKENSSNLNGLETMIETILRFGASSGAKESNKIRDLRPVNKEEASTIFNNYYKDKYGDEGRVKKKLDYERKKSNALVPGQANSYLYRPFGKAISGPEKYDMKGVDDNPAMHIGEGLVLPTLLDTSDLETIPALKSRLKKRRNRTRSKSRH